jgi:competence protein ComEC
MQRFVLFSRQRQPQVQTPVIVAIGMLIGALWYFTRSYEPDLIWLCAAAIMTATFVSVATRFPGGVLQLGLISFAISLGALAGGFASSSAGTISVSEETEPVWLEGWIETALPASRGARLEIRVHAIDGWSPQSTPARVRLTHRLSLNSETGRFVRCWVVLRPPPAPVLRDDYAFDLQAWFDGLGAVGYVQGRCRGASLGAPVVAHANLENWISTRRRELARYVSIAAGDRAGGFAAALASGDRSLMQSEDQEALRGAGLAHLLAISGLHMGIVGGLVFLLSWRIGALFEGVALRWHIKKPAALIAITACFVYLVLSGASVSTQRAFMMAFVLFGAVLIDRTAFSLRSLSIAMILVILWAPWSVLTPGFQMSFAATGALIACYERWQTRTRAQAGARRRRAVFWVQSLIVTSTVSGLATMPFALYHFGRAASGGFIANLLAMPIISLISAPAAASALLLSPVHLDWIALRVFGWSLEAVLAIAHAFSALVPDDLWLFPAMPGASLGVAALAIVWFCLSRRAWLAWTGALGLIGLSLVVWGMSARDRLHWSPSGDVYLESAMGGLSRAQLFEGDGLAPLRFKDKRTTPLCVGSEVCKLAYAGVDVEYDRMNNKLNFTTREGASYAIAWSQVTRENGVSLVFANGTIQPEPKIACDRRPWRPCRDSAGTP